MPIATLPIMSSPQRIITDTDKAPLVEVLSMMFLVIAVLACFVRSGTKIHMVKALKIDDILAVAAAVSKEQRQHNLTCTRRPLTQTAV